MKAYPLENRPENGTREKACISAAAAITEKMNAPAQEIRTMLDRICAGISLGKSTRAMCIETGISQRLLWSWLAGSAEFMEQYLRAKELCVDAYAEEIIEISDDRSQDLHLDEKGREITNREAIARTQLRIDARKWYASRLAPKKYGDKAMEAQTGNDRKTRMAPSIEIAFVPAGRGDGAAGLS
ncbi:MAG: hypothetical protein BGO99_09090 [Nitrosospira sp. 56-18]|jgi:hypothetical protein|nr:MAG: hypothetical protein BGO99_09090 [Nitrosospira sp. 56-18]